MRWTIGKFCLLAFLGKWTFDTYGLVQEDIAQTIDNSFDPYKILMIENDATFGTKEIKKQYRRLSLSWHPDKVDFKVIPEATARSRYEQLVMAYKTLTDTKMFNNWIKFGHPDGSVSAKAMGFALPAWMFEEAWRPYMFGFILLFIIVVVVSALNVVNYKETECFNGISLDSKDAMTDMILGILKDNAGNVRVRGFKPDDIIDTFEQASEVMALNEECEKKCDFRDVVNRLTTTKKPKKGEKPPEEISQENTDKVLKLVPRLNEVIIEIITELSAERTDEGDLKYKFNKEAFFNALNRFTTLFETFRIESRIEKREVGIRVEVDGQTNKFQVGDLLTVNAKIETIKPDQDTKTKTFETRNLWIACVTQISGRAVIQRFIQKKPVEEITFKTMLIKPGRESYKILVLDGYGEMVTSLVKQISIIDNGNYHGYQAEDLQDGPQAAGED